MTPKIYTNNGSMNEPGKQYEAPAESMERSSDRVQPATAKISEVDMEGSSAIPEDELAKMSRTYGFAEG